MMGGLGKSQSHERSDRESNSYQQRETSSSMNMSGWEGSERSSRKKIREERVRNIVRRGANRKLPMIDAAERGKPHISKMGQATSDRKSWRCR